MAVDLKIPNGVSNSAGLGSTPGTVTTTANNVGGGNNLNPNMPIQSQLNKQGRSGLHQGLSGPAPRQPTSRVPKQRQSKVISQGLPMDGTRGYNIFSGQNAQEISDTNQKMGLSNLTALPSLQQLNPAAAQNLKPGRPLSMRFMDGTPEGDGTNPFTWDPSGNPVSGDGTNPWGWGGPVEPTKDEVMNEALFTDIPEHYLGGGGVPPVTQDDYIQEAADSMEDDENGINAEKKQEMYDLLDQEYSYKIQFALDNLDRQAAMMGTFGSGTHMRNVNNAIAQSLADMADNYNDINILDAQLAETDHQQNIDNFMKLSEGVAGSYEDKMNMAIKVDEFVITPLAEWLGSQTSMSDGDKLQVEQWVNSVGMEMIINLLAQDIPINDVVTLVAAQIKHIFNSLEFEEPWDPYGTAF